METIVIIYNISSSENAGNSSDTQPWFASVDKQSVYTPDSYDPRNWNNLDNKAFIRERTYI
jgi:hypothetical protein